MAIISFSTDLYTHSQPQWQQAWGRKDQSSQLSSERQGSSVNPANETSAPVLQPCWKCCCVHYHIIVQKNGKEHFFNWLFQSSAKLILLNFICIRLRHLFNTQLHTCPNTNAKHNHMCCWNCFCCKCRLDKPTQKCPIRCLIVQAVPLLKCRDKIAVTIN